MVCVKNNDYDCKYDHSIARNDWFLLILFVRKSLTTGIDFWIDIEEDSESYCLKTHAEMLLLLTYYNCIL